MLLVLAGRKVIIAVYYRRKQKRVRDNFVIGISQITWLLIVLIGFIGFLLLFNVPVKEFFTSISILGAAIALIFKDYIGNGINGMIIMFSDKLNINDQVKIGFHKGRVLDLSLMHVHLIDDDDDVVFIPNNLVLANEIINYTKADKKQSSVEFQVKPSSLPSLNAYENQIMNELGENADILRSGTYRLRVEEVNKGIVEIKFQCALKEPNRELERMLRQKIKRAMLDCLVKND